jgi:dTDP-glucose 4,6-dehydratase
MSYKPLSLLVTGGAGFIGSNFVRHWLSKSAMGRVIVLDALTYAGNVESLQGLDGDPRYRFVKGDICDEELVAGLLHDHEANTIVHFAAESHVDRSIDGPDAFIRTNVVGTHSLLKAAKKAWLSESTWNEHRFHHISTDEVYGSLGAAESPFTESSQYAPNSPYSASKAASDHLVRAYGETYGLQTVTTNCSNNYGPFQFPEKLIPLIIINVLLGKSLPVYGDGLQIRDWLHVGDHCSAIELALHRGVPGHVYNIGGNSETANIDIVGALCDLLDERVLRDASVREKFPDAPAAKGGRARDLISHVRDRLGHDRRYAINFAKAAQNMGYRPQHSLKTGLTQTVDWYISAINWWRPLLGANYADWISRNYSNKFSA